MKKSVFARQVDDLLQKATGRHGLCAYCAAAPGCSFLRASGPPVLQCEEFETANGPEAIEYGADRRPRRDDEHPPSGEARPVWERTGLCGNCENFATCTFPKDEGGIWHCEEYR